MRLGRVSVAVLAATVLATLGVTAGASAAPHSGFHNKAACPDRGRPGRAECTAEVLVHDVTGRPVDPKITTTTSAASAADIQSAYGLAGLKSGGRTVAIVDAYGYPNAASDLDVFRTANALGSCTVASGCLTIINQAGGSTLPAFDLTWAGEQALDLDAVSAACPDCKILLVQADSADLSDLGPAVNTAANWPGVVAISNSYSTTGGDETDSTYGSYYNHPGIAVVAATGDDGYSGAVYPASSRYVTAVGGTTLTRAANTRGWTETAWSGSGSGCSTLNGAPVGQSSTVTGCTGRALADVSADADPYTGLMVYGPSTSSTNSSWQQWGGTSLAAPIVASVFALAGKPAGYSNDMLYQAQATGFYDITTGSNGTCTTWCTAKTGWDGPTGLGTPNGIAAFTAPVTVTVTPAAVTFADPCGTADDTYTIPSTTGVAYTVAGQVKTAGTYAGTGTVTVTAEALPGYSLTGTTTWPHTFGTTACPVTPIVSRLAGDDRYATAVEVSKAAFPMVGTSTPVVYIATGENFPDALAGGAAAGHGVGSLLLVGQNSIPAVVATELTRLKPAKIVIQGGSDVVSDAVATALASYTTGTVTRNSGTDRYETALLTSQRAFPDAFGGTVMIATGNNYPDALSAGSLFRTFPGPILLNDPTGGLTAAAKAELARLKPARVFLLGGADVVPAQVATDATALGFTVERLAGDDRYATSLAIAQKAFPVGVKVDEVYVATGANFPDGLAAGPLARANTAPLVLTNGTCWDPAVLAYVKSINPTALTLIGGSDVVAATVGTLTACTP